MGTAMPHQHAPSRAVMGTSNAELLPALTTALHSALTTALTVTPRGFAPPPNTALTNTAPHGTLGTPALTAKIAETFAAARATSDVVTKPFWRGAAVLYDNPKEVGADRIANAVGAFDLYGGPTIVVDFGTATTFDVISDRGEYLGGAIVPGIEISLDALFGRAAALRQVELVEPRSVIGKTTVESIQSGALYGYASLVDGMCERIEALIGEATIIATGGLAGLLTPITESIEHEEPWLTLHGLRLVWEKNQS